MLRHAASPVDMLRQCAGRGGRGGAVVGVRGRGGRERGGAVVTVRGRGRGGRSRGRGRGVGRPLSQEHQREANLEAERERVHQWRRNPWRQNPRPDPPAATHRIFRGPLASESKLCVPKAVFFSRFNKILAYTLYRTLTKHTFCEYRPVVVA